MTLPDDLPSALHDWTAPSARRYALDDAGDLVLMRELLLCVKQMQRVASGDELRDMADSLLTARSAHT